MTDTATITDIRLPKPELNAHGRIETIVYFVAEDGLHYPAFKTGPTDALGFMRCEASTWRKQLLIEAIQRATAPQVLQDG